MEPRGSRDQREQPTAAGCHARSHALDDSEKRRFFAVLHQGPVDSPEVAVRAAIIQEQLDSL